MKKVRACVIILVFLAGITLLIWYVTGLVNNQLDQSSVTTNTSETNNSISAQQNQTVIPNTGTAATQQGDATEVTTVKLSSLENSYFNAIGSVKSKGTVSIFPLTSGAVKKVNFEEGDYVKEGDVILEISGANLSEHASETQLKIAETTLANAKVAYNNLQKTSAETLKTAGLQLQSATNQAAAVDYDLQVMEQNKAALQDSLDLLNDSLDNTQIKNARDEYKSQRDIDDLISTLNKAQDDRSRTQRQINDLEDQLAGLQANSQNPADPAIAAAQAGLTKLQTALTAQDKGIEDLYSALDKSRYGYSTAGNVANLGENTLEGQILTGENSAEVLDLNLLSTKTKLGYTGDSTDALQLARQAYNSTKVQLSTALESAANSVKLAELSESLARSQASALQVKAPFSGVITMLDLYPGQNVNPQTAAAEIIDPRSFELEVGIDLATADRISGNLPAQIELAGREIEVPVKSISPKVDDKTKLVNVTLGLPNIFFRVNQNLKVKLPLSNTAGLSGTRYLPLDAVIIGTETQFVYVNDNGKAKKVEVKIGQVSGDQIEIVSGLPAGAEIILTGAKNLSEGESIKVISE
jgi:RND family efflux transporter MFP subunit